MFNAIGSVSKTLFGTLTESNLEYVNSELDKLYEDNRVLAISISNQTQVIRAILNSASNNADTLMEHNKGNVGRFNKMTLQINNNTRNILITNQITMWVMMLELSEDINLEIDAINNGKHRIIQPQLLTPRIFLDGFKEFEESLNTKYQFL